ncbi:MAG: carbohydrate binding family 9 domain-containing protein, partial [Actinomycetota bacterium]|nr:carbohydrate binding family 9 domain-containing protein [Actinomycetota bacterium]
MLARWPRISLALLLLPGLLHGIQARPHLRAASATGPIVVDGLLKEASWAAAPALSELVQREPGEGAAGSERTEVRFLYDSTALYVAGWLFDSDPGSVVAGQALRDASLTDADAFLLVLDPYLDRQNGYLFGTTPAGIEYDAQIANEGRDGGGQGGGRQQSGAAAGFNLNWDGSWTVATSRDDRGWYVEMRIPFATLRYPNGGVQRWGMNVERRIRRKNELAVWAPLPRQLDLTRVSLAGTLELEAPSRRVVTVSPYASSELFRDYRAPTPATDFAATAGVDAKIGLTQDLTLDLTVNTDFAQAEVDDQQVNLTRFSLFLPEKRGFFLENAGTFAVGASRTAELFFTRRIGLSGGREVPILAGARLTGRLAGWQVGLLSIQTDDLTAPGDLPGTAVRLAPPTNFAVLRAFREFPSRSHLGLMLVNRMNTAQGGDNQQTFGLDAAIGSGQDLRFDGWLGLTATPQAPGATPPSGFNRGEYGLGLGGRYITRDWQLTAGYRQIGEHFDPEVGFVNRTGYRHVNARVLRHLRTDGIPWFREFRPHISWSHFWSLDGFAESYLVHFDNHFAFENGAFFQLPGFNLTGEGLREPFAIREGIVIPVGTYHNYDWEFRFNTNRSAPLSLS